MIIPEVQQEAWGLYCGSPGGCRGTVSGWGRSGAAGPGAGGSRGAGQGRQGLGQEEGRAGPGQSLGHHRGGLHVHSHQVLRLSHPWIGACSVEVEFGVSMLVITKYVVLERLVNAKNTIKFCFNL